MAKSRNRQAGTAMALSRGIIAVMENYQDADGNIAVPEVLLPYMGGLDKITTG